MKFKNAVRNAFNKCDTPDNTLQRIKTAFKAIGYHPTWAPVRVTDTLFWGRIWIDELKIICEGKGTTAQLAEASAHAELAERFSAGLYYPVFEEQVRFHLPAIYGKDTNDFLNYAWLPGYINARQEEIDPALTIETLLERQRQLTPETIDAIKDCEMAGHWVDGYSLLRDRTVKVPIKFAAYIHGSNGVAAGNTIEEAMLQAGAEILERHVQIDIVKNETIAPTIDPGSIQTPLVRDMIDFYSRSNVRVTIKDLSGSGTLPVVGVLFANDNLASDSMEYHTLIAGASFSNPEEALTRCFTEGIQGKETLTVPRKAFNRPVIPGSRVKDYYSLMKCGVSPKDISFLQQGETVPFPRWHKKDIAAEIEGLKQMVKKMGTDCILIDLTHPVLRFPVVRVVIPGVSDFLNYLPPDILSDPKTSPITAWRGENFKTVMETFFSR